MIDDPRCATKKKSLLFFLSGAGAALLALPFNQSHLNQTRLMDELMKESSASSPGGKAIQINQIKSIQSKEI